MLAVPAVEQTACAVALVVAVSAAACGLASDVVSVESAGPEAGSVEPSDTAALPSGSTTAVAPTTTACSHGAGSPGAVPGGLGSGENSCEAPVAIEPPSTTAGQSGTGLLDLEPIDIDTLKAELTYSGDLSTPLGKLCWAMWKEATVDVLRFYEGFFDITYLQTHPNYPEARQKANETVTAILSILNGDDEVGPVSVVTEDSLDTEIEKTYINILEEIQTPDIVGVVDDARLSEELQVFAEAYFDSVALTEQRIKAGGLSNIDFFNQTEYDLPNEDVFNKELISNPEECGTPPLDDVE